ncbi:hypothetical protein PRK78_006952 [Emydomyces testavorans]|uniref:mitogen-activated protein kinase n=1 Tax=Emydomyces testavorans TaxID=2070801 RepID=A0AAF0DPD3_9EURO|nr:hypothetical protein PRK78_006952 [Emydomyces testavorans]
MSLEKPHPLALFSLVPKNPGAWDVLNHPSNKHLVSVVVDPNDPKKFTQGLNVGFHSASRSESRYTLATLGRSGADITVGGAIISRIHCSFEIHEITEAVMLYDRSTAASTQVFGESATPFEPELTPRRVVVDHKTNLEFGIGGVDCNAVQFCIVWHRRDYSIGEKPSIRPDNPWTARTVDETPTINPTRRVTRIRTTKNKTKIRYLNRGKIGQGSFGEVVKAMNIDSGELFAVKQVEWPALQSHRYISLKQEVETVSRMSHPNIIKHLSTQLCGNKFEIFMELKHGNIQHLIDNDIFINDFNLAESLLRQMLQALDYLAYGGIIHRDVKPENILYKGLPDGSCEFQLADFGLCTLAANATEYAGSGVYMAPELESHDGAPQTPKMDIWSLFVIFAYALNVARFRYKPLHTLQMRINAVQAAANGGLRCIQDMAVVNPTLRASAADMLIKLFAGEGLTTPHKEVWYDAMVLDTAPATPRMQQVGPVGC